MQSTFLTMIHLLYSDLGIVGDKHAVQIENFTIRWHPLYPFIEFADEE